MSYFHHKDRHASIVAGNTLFIDGGDVTTWDRQGNGYTNGSKLVKNNDTRTYSIDLTRSWSTNDVPITPIIKDIPAFDSGTLWLNASGDSFYQYNGGVSRAQQPYPDTQPNQLWSYALNGQSSRWTNSTSVAVSNIKRVQGATSASGNGLGFALGGFQAAETTNTIATGFQHVGGMIVFNSSSQSWNNVSSFGDYTYSSSGAGLFVPTFGPAGLFIPFGGLTPSESPLALDYANMYEPTTQTWRKQRVSGDVPPPVQNPCVAGAAGDNGTYEVFLYGGLQEARNGWRQVDPAVYILSLPSFHWFRISNTGAVGRHRHSCNVAGKSQIISTGGIIGSIKELTFASVEDLGGPDPWPQQGVGVFNMNALQWTTQYDPNAAAYATPDLVKSYIASNGPTPSSFDDATIKSWFPVRFTNATSTTSSSPQTTSTAPSTQSTQSTGNTASAATTTTTTTGLSTGALVGAIVGPIVAVILLVALALWLRSRHKRHMRTKTYTQTSDEQTGASHTASFSPVELHGDSQPYESGGKEFYELDHTRHELK